MCDMRELTAAFDSHVCASRRRAAAAWCLDLAPVHGTGIARGEPQVNRSWLGDGLKSAGWVKVRRFVRAGTKGWDT